jgi:hypothetical protein
MTLCNRKYCGSKIFMLKNNKYCCIINIVSYNLKTRVL